jgi:hypothetical protein
MLAHLDALCAALLSRNAIEIYRLLNLPEARKLPRAVREEAIAIAKAGPTSHMAPIQALHLFYKLSHLVDESTELTPEPHREPAYSSNPQMEIQFRPRKAG